MRKASLFLVGVLLVGVTWQIATAAPPSPPLQVCVRAGTDLRAPATNGTCPSGYTKVAVNTDLTSGGPELVASSAGIVIPFDDGISSGSLPLNGVHTEPLGPFIAPGFAQALSVERRLTTLRVNVRTVPGQAFTTPVTLDFSLAIQEDPSPDFGAALQCTITLSTSPTTDGWHTCTGSSPTPAGVTIPAGSLLWINLVTEGSALGALQMDIATAVS